MVRARTARRWEWSLRSAHAGAGGATIPECAGSARAASRARGHHFIRHSRATPRDRERAAGTPGFSAAYRIVGSNTPSRLPPPPRSLQGGRMGWKGRSRLDDEGTRARRHVHENYFSREGFTARSSRTEKNHRHSDAPPGAHDQAFSPGRSSCRCPYSLKGALDPQGRVFAKRPGHGRSSRGAFNNPATHAGHEGWLG